MKMKKILSFLLAAALVFTIALPAFAAGYNPPSKGGYVYASVDINTLGDGFLCEPVKVPFSAGESYEAVALRLLGASNIVGENDPDMGLYIAGIVLPRNITVKIPQIILNKIGTPLSGSKAKGSALSEKEYSYDAGWMFTTNNAMVPMGLSSWYPQDGDVFRMQFSLYGYGADLGVALSWPEAPAPLYNGADRGALLKAAAEINSSSDRVKLLADSDVLAAYNSANTVLTNLTVTQSQVNSAQAALQKAVDAFYEKSLSFWEKLFAGAHC